MELSSLVKCILCEAYIPTTEDNYMPECCGEEIVCKKCHNREHGRVSCKRCGKNSRCNRIAGVFFKNIEIASQSKTEESYVRKMLSIAEPQPRKLQERQGQKEIGKVRELKRPVHEPKIKRLEKIANSVIKDHIHADECRPYTNIQSMSRARFTPYGKGIPTIHDVLSFQCNFCGHGPMNTRVNQKGEEVRVKQHSMWECHVECCGQYLDRRYLQYNNGNCECGIIIMQTMTITPSSEDANKWRRDLYLLKGQGVKTKDIQNLLAPEFEKMNISKPHMLIWYIIAHGSKLIRTLMDMTDKDRQETLGMLTKLINSEYMNHKPIQ